MDNREPQSQGDDQTQNMRPVDSTALPYRPLPPIRTVPDSPPRVQPVNEPPNTRDLEALTPVQLENWRKVIAMQFNPFIARFLSDEDILWYRNKLQAAVRER